MWYSYVPSEHVVVTNILTYIAGSMRVKYMKISEKEKKFAIR
jgi:hypothetical protein